MKSKYNIIQKNIYSNIITYTLTGGKEFDEKYVFSLIKKGNIENAIIVKRGDIEYIRAKKGYKFNVVNIESSSVNLTKNIVYKKAPNSNKKIIQKVFKRKIYSDLLYWKDNLDTVLYLKGPRQVGKTYLLKQFGKENFKHVIYINLSSFNNKEAELKKRFKDIFYTVMSNRTLDSEEECRNSWYTIFYNLYEKYTDDDDTLIILDEIQDDMDIYNCIRELHLYINAKVAVSGSFLGIATKPGYFIPTGDIFELILSSLNYEEFLDACGVLEDYNLIKGYSLMELSEKEKKIYKDIEKLYNVYISIGGYPDVIHKYLTLGVKDAYLQIEQLVDSYFEESKRYTTNIFSLETLRKTLSILTQSIVLKTVSDINLSLNDVIFRDNNFNLDIKNKDITDALHWLEESHIISSIEVYGDNFILSKNKYKFYFNDLGFLNYMLEYAGIKPSDANGCITENFVYLYLYDNRKYKLNNPISVDRSVHSYETKSNEIDFILNSLNGKRIAIEAKHNKGKVKSSDVFLSDGKVHYIVKYTNTFGGESKDGKKFTVPLFAITKASNLIRSL